jgi:hypothetical protein
MAAIMAAMSVLTAFRTLSLFEPAPFALASPELDRLYRYWREKRGPYPMPLRADIDPLEIPYMLGHLMLVDIHGPGRYFVRLHGTEMARRVGYDLTGKMLDALPVPHYRNLALGHFDEVASTGVPHRSLTDRVIDDRLLRYEAAILPLSHRGAVANKLLIGMRYLS